MLKQFRSLLFFMTALSVAFRSAVVDASTAAFVRPTKRAAATAPKQCRLQQTALPSPEESAKALTDYMAKAHEEKIRVMAQVKSQYQDEIQQLQEQVEELRSRSPLVHPISSSSTGSFEMPATNRGLAEKVHQYRTFIANYLVKAQEEKVQAVATAQDKLRQEYATIIEELTEQQEQQGNPFFAESGDTTSSSSAETASELTGKGGFQ